MNELETAAAHLRAKVRRVASDEACFGVRSRGERIAVAVVLDRDDLLKRVWGTIAEAGYRLRPRWSEAALRVPRDAREEEPLD